MIYATSQIGGVSFFSAGECTGWTSGSLNGTYVNNGGHGFPAALVSSGLGSGYITATRLSAGGQGYGAGYKIPPGSMYFIYDDRVGKVSLYGTTAGQGKSGNFQRLSGGLESRSTSYKWANEHLIYVTSPHGAAGEWAGAGEWRMPKAGGILGQDVRLSTYCWRSTYQY